MSKIALNFFGEIVSVEKPQSLASLRNDIARLFFFSSQDAEEILLTYNDNGDKLIISSDEDLKAFLNSKNTKYVFGNESQKIFLEMQNSFSTFNQENN